MGYNMKRGNSAVPFKQLGSSPAKADDDIVAYEGKKVNAGNAPGTGTAKAIVEGTKVAYNAADKVTKATKKSKKNEAKHGSTGRKV